MRRRTRRPPEADRSPSHERWLVSYADFITLLFAFFTVLYASSTVDGKKLDSVATSMQAVFARGAIPDGSPADVPLPIEPRAAISADPLDLLRQALARDLAAEIDLGHLSLDRDARGIVVSIRESGSFPTGSADLPPATEDLLVRLAHTLQSVPNIVRVEGHTDDVPIQGGRYASNWELSTARATRVVDFLITTGGIGAERLSAAGYSEFHPVVPNDTPANRSRNRRVDLVILREAVRRAEEPAAPAH